MTKDKLIELKLKYFALPCLVIAITLFLAWLHGGIWYENFNLGITIGVGYTVAVFMIEYLIEKHSSHNSK